MTNIIHNFLLSIFIYSKIRQYSGTPAPPSQYWWNAPHPWPPPPTCPQITHTTPAEPARSSCLPGPGRRGPPRRWCRRRRRSGSPPRWARSSPCRWKACSERPPPHFGSLGGEEKGRGKREESGRRDSESQGVFQGHRQQYTAKCKNPEWSLKKKNKP